MTRSLTAALLMAVLSGGLAPPTTRDAGPADLPEPTTRPAPPVALPVAPPADAAVAGRYVRDGARLFGPQASEDAEAIAAQMDRQYHKQLVVETFAAVPDAARPVIAQDKAGYFRQWMHARFKVRDVNGVYVLVCMDPRYVEVGVGTQTLARGVFTKADVDGLTRRLIADLRAQRYDAALAGATDYVAGAYAAHIPGARPLVPPAP